MKPWRSKKYLSWIRYQPCVICGGESQAHHIIGHGFGGMAIKAADVLAIPVCATHHDELHRHGHQTWEDNHGSQLLHLARTIETAFRDGVLDVRD